MFWKKNKLKKVYQKGMVDIQLSLYEIFISVLKDDIGDRYSIEKIKEAAAITVNKLGLKHDDRPDPLTANDDLSKSLSCIKELTMIKEATAIILLFDYYYSEKKLTKHYRKAKNIIDSNTFKIIDDLIKIDRTSAKKILSLSSAISSKLQETANIDISKQFS